MNALWGIFRHAAAPVVALAVFLSVPASPPKAQAQGFVMDGCPMQGTRNLASTIFGPYQYSAAGSNEVFAGAVSGILPADADITNCIFVRRMLPGPKIDRSSDMLSSGFGQLANAAALQATWKNLISRLGLTTSQRGKLHLAGKPGFVAGYRDGDPKNMIGFALWLQTTQGPLYNVPALRLSPLVTYYVCAGKSC